MTASNTGLAAQPIVRSATPRPKTTDFVPILATCITWATIISFLGGLAMWLVTGNALDGLAMGLFTAFWAGPGFGAMIAVSIWSSRNETH